MKEILLITETDIESLRLLGELTMLKSNPMNEEILIKYQKDK